MDRVILRLMIDMKPFEKSSAKPPQAFAATSEDPVTPQVASPPFVTYPSFWQAQFICLHLDMVRSVSESTDGYAVSRSSNGESSDESRDNNHAATGASAAGIRALSTQFMAFYFRAPVKAFMRMRVEYVSQLTAVLRLTADIG